MEKKQSNTGKEKGKSNKTTYVVLGISLGVLSLAGLGYWYFKGRKGTKVEDKEEDLFHQVANESSNATTNYSQSTSPKSTTPKTSVSNISFPLKKGSKGALVKQAQEALIKLYGAGILPKYGADGQFGTEMTNALKSKGYKEIIDLTEFTKIISATGTNPAIVSTLSSGLSNVDAVDIAKKLYINSAVPKLTPVLAELKRIKTIQDYTAVNELFKTLILRGVRQTIVNGVLGSFSDDTSKQLIRAEFIRMGLKYDGAKWSLSGIPQRQLITKVPTTIRSLCNAELDVPENTLLGLEVGTTHDRTTFKTLNHEILTVPTKHIQYV
jgi:hypothetical protein